MAATQQISISNMTCGGCAARVQRTLDAAEGIDDPAVNFATHSATLRARSSDALAAALAALAKAGYPATTRPADDTAATDRDTHLRRFILALVLALPVIVIEMGGHLIPAFHHSVQASLGQTGSWTLQAILTALVLSGPGRVFFERGIPALLRRQPDMNTLVAIGTGAAFAYSMLVLVWPGALPPAARAVYFESACVIVVFILLGNLLEHRAKSRTGDAIRRLMRLQPDRAHVYRDGGWHDIAASDLTIGDRIMLRPGARVPADATVAEGQSEIDAAMMTGEPLPVAVAPGDTIVGGTVNGTGVLMCDVTRVGDDSQLAQIIRLVETAQGTRLPIQSLVDRITLLFVPVILALGALTVLVWAIFGPDPRLSYMLVAGVSVLIIACPCAMGLATPMSIMVGTGRAAEMGILFRGATALQTLQDVRVVAFDKTGTLTQGKPVLADLHLPDGVERDTALSLIAAVERHSEHPIATALLAAAEGTPERSATDTRALPGRGIEGRVDGHTIRVGKADWLRREGVDLSALPDTCNFYAAQDGQALAGMTISDSLKPTAVRAVRDLHDRGIAVALITGDSVAAADQVSAALGITEVFGSATPEDKQTALATLRATHGKTAFVGDGINDAPVLAAADVGIAIGTGTDVAKDAADVVLVSGDPALVAQAIIVSGATLRNIRQNLGWAFGYNVALVPVAAGVLYPAFGMLLSPALAAGAMALSSVLVVTNALRLRRLGGTA
ncbi:heavy metal translocating P-type ATPase [Sulfitobacter sp. S190]|uniref:heavy metal translocating P-type ATPase n=1 Tax=Sulfitobacter sp. S190 TaxID=2867022 RepID=UPI0021A5621C|nr:heavy metal translocating P-type ATPase [Sulfitobacter sp. S190]UWR22433.1 cadmium-translocating P-type ATPase [Sulfitobacter sp. S190]